MMKNNSYLAFVFSSLLFYMACDDSIKEDHSISMQVTATAYNTTEFQTKKGNDGVAAWGDTLVPGEKAIAVSRDLIKAGLKHNNQVKIEGFDGIYIVKDKMNKRWKNRIDIYMGLDKDAALEWGKQKVKIAFDTIRLN